MPNSDRPIAGRGKSSIITRGVLFNQTTTTERRFRRSWAMNTTCKTEQQIIPDEETQNALLRDLTSVGPLKIVGYLPIYTIRQFLGTSPKALATAAAARGLATALFTTRTTRIKSGALYVYDRNALERLLSNEADAVQVAGLPLDADAFVAHIANVFYEAEHPAHRLIAAAFGENLQDD
ncbi:hypothetical protein J2W42_006817 [Rhizobium tibeticum]|uniref:hypothetical protein n=1 Tax=Rhizobium tibeticum TaxID=501024 RepID=UPI00278B7ECF|nr:hypothetical protein [Rhizobium tibeticum]MDP9813940.1 hypothetical protein [Rhizobium tibeticum]